MRFVPLIGEHGFRDPSEAPSVPHDYALVRSATAAKTAQKHTAKSNYQINVGVLTACSKIVGK